MEKPAVDPAAKFSSGRVRGVRLAVFVWNLLRLSTDGAIATILSSTAKKKNLGPRRKAFAYCDV